MIAGVMSGDPGKPETHFGGITVDLGHNLRASGDDFQDI